MNFVCSEVENMSISIEYYDFIKQMYENLTKYIKAYKSETNDYYKKILKIHDKYYPKLSTIKEELKKKNNIKTNHIISLSSKVPKIINQQIINLKYFITGIDATIKSFDKTLKEKNSMSSKYQSEYEDSRNALIKKYKDIEKSKNTYFSNAAQTENLIYKFYLSKSTKKEQNSTITESTPVTEIQIENSIKTAKKNENDYSNLVKSAKTLEDNFCEISDSSIDNMKRIACEIITKMKDNIVDFLLLLKNCFKLPLSEIDTYLPELIKLDENKKIENIINSTYKKDHGLIQIVPEKYNIKLIQKSLNNGNDYENNNMIEEEEILSTIKKMEENFDLIEKDSIEQINSKDKLRSRELTFKLLSFSPHIKEEMNNNINITNEKDKEKESEKENEKESDKEKEKENENDNNKNIENDNNNNIEKEQEKENQNTNDTSITEEEVDELLKLMENRDNRYVFLRHLNTFRKYGQFELPEKEFSIICNIFNKISEFIKKENDFDSMRNVIILSVTYYKMDNKNKIYIQKILKRNQMFKEKEIWEYFVNSSILNEVQKHLNKDIKELDIKDSQKALEKGNYNKLIFSQLMTSINNMNLFDVSENVIKSIIQTSITYYKIDEDSSKLLLDSISNKNNCELTVIEEDDEDITSADKNIVTKAEGNNVDENTKKEILETEEDINMKFTEKVNETIDDDQDINSRMIKEITSDEINDQMIKDIDEEEEQEQEDIDGKQNDKKEEEEKKENEQNKK